MQHVVDSFEAVDIALDVLGEHLLRLDLPLWISRGASGCFKADRFRLSYALRHFEPTAGLKSQETITCPGTVAGTSITLELIDQVNSAKDAFKALVHSYCLSLGTTPALKWIHDILKISGYPAIKLKQVYRHIPYIRYHPRRIAWSRGKHSSVKKLAKPELTERLLKAGRGVHIDIQLEKLNVLADHAQLTIRRTIKPCWVVNIVKDGRYEDLRTSLPIFFLHDSALPDPTVCFAKPMPRPQLRKDNRAETLPYLPSISAHRYLPSQA